MTLPPAQLLPFAATSADLTLYTGLMVLRGWSFAETAGATASFALYDGADDTTVQVVPINLIANETTRDLITGNGLLIRTGLFLEMFSGTIKGTIYFNPLLHADDHDWAIGDWGPYYVHPGA